MNLDEQLTELLATLGVELEEGERASAEYPAPAGDGGASSDIRGVPGGGQREGDFGMDFFDEEAQHEPDFSLFQTSREHYGVFYRLDLVGCVPQLRIFTPEEAGAVKMRCYLVRPAIGSPVRDWFLATRMHDGSPLFEEARETTEQHLLFAAGETLKRLFWGGDADAMYFSPEIDVQRLV